MCLGIVLCWLGNMWYKNTRFNFRLPRRFLQSLLFPDYLLFLAHFVEVPFCPLTFMLCDGCWITCSVSKNWPFNLNLNSGEVRSENFVLFATQNLCVLDQSCWHCSSSLHHTLVSKTSVLQRELHLDSLSLLDEFMVHPVNVRKKQNISVLLVMLLLPSVLDAADSFSEECCLVSGS